MTLSVGLITSKTAVPNPVPRVLGLHHFILMRYAHEWGMASPNHEETTGVKGGITLKALNMRRKFG